MSNPNRYHLYTAGPLAAALFILALLSAGPAAAQAGVVSELDVKNQELFIDAKREQLLGNYDKAIELLDAILKKDRENAAAAYELARIYDQKDEAQRSLRFAQNAADWDPQNIWYLKYLAELQQKLGQYDKASETYGAIVELAPYQDEHYYRHAFLLVKANQIKDALKVYDALEKRLGVTEELIRRKHALYLGQRDDKKAARELIRLVEAYPRDMDYRHLLAGFYEQIGDEQAARQVYQEILQIDPGNGKAQLALAGQSTQARDEIRYLSSLESAFRQPDTDIDLKIGKLMPFIQKVADSGDRELADAALELTSLLESVHPDQAKAFSAAADLLYHSGRQEAALEKYLKTLELDETNFIVWAQIMDIYAQLHRYTELLDFTERSMDYYPNQPVIYYMNALASHQLGEPQAALNTLQQAAFMAGSDPQMQVLIKSLQGLAYNKLGQAERSDQAFREALGLDSTAPPALSRYAYALALRGQRLEEAERMARKANELMPGQAEFEAHLGWVLHQQQQYPDAQKWLQKALEKGGKHSPALLEHYGDLLYALDQIDEAVDYWKQARDAGNASAGLRQKIEQRRIIK